MKITSVDVLPIGQAHDGNALLVLGTDSSLVGIGELAGTGLEAPGWANDRVAKLLIGRDPFDLQALAMEQGSDGRGAFEAAVFAAASTAMADLSGQHLGVPAHQLLGGRVRDRVRVCAIDWAGGVTAPGELVQAASRVVAAGFDALKVELPATSGVQAAARLNDIAGAVEAIRAELPDRIDVVVAADADFDSAAIMALGVRTARFEPLWLECSCDGEWPIRADGAAQLTVPIAGAPVANHADLRSLLAAGRVDHLVIDVGSVGGLLAARRIAALAELYHVGIVPRGRTPVSFATAIHLAAVIPNLTMVEMRPALAPVVGGMVEVNLSSGLGVDVGGAVALEVV